jgi:hypothetical protein
LRLDLLLDANLLFVVCLSAVVSLLSSLNVAARPAAVITGRSATASTIASLFFMVTRLANMFYLPLMAGFVGHAKEQNDLGGLYGQIQWVIMGAAAGAAISWILLPNFVSLYGYLVEKVYTGGMGALARPASVVGSIRSFLARAQMPGRIGQLHGIPVGFLFFNVLATAVWTVGALAALYCSAAMPQFSSTAILLSGLVNSVAAIAFSVCVDPQAALITDRVLDPEKSADQRNPPEQVYSAARHLALGNVLGSLLGVVTLPLAISVISYATSVVGSGGDDAVGSVWVVVGLNTLMLLLASTTYAARVSAVVTKQVQTALVVYNFFFLVTRLSGQVYAPILGAMSDHLKHQQRLDLLEHHYRMILGGAALGALLGLLLLPTFIEIYNQAVRQLQRRNSLPLVLLQCLNPANWGAILRCIRPPSLMGVRLSDLRSRPAPELSIPKVFLLGNVIVLAIHTVGVMAAIYAGAHLDEKTSRAATLLSSVVNGVATITLSLIVDPTLARLTDQCIEEKRPQRDMRVAAVFLMLGMFVGTLLSQLIFEPAAWFITQGARLLQELHEVID